MRKYAVLVLFIISSHAMAAGYRLDTIADDLDKPWSVAFLPDGSFLVTERAGELLHIREDGSRTSLAGVPATYFAGQGGFFDIVLDPAFLENRIVYLSYAHGTPDSNGTGVLRARLGDAGLEETRLILLSEPARATPQHYGGRLLFLPDGTLLVTVGDGFEYREAAQDIDQQLGKILRINTDGSVPQDNPYFDRGELAAKVWTYGHRNSQGLAMNTDGSAVYMHEHGPRGGDEVNLVQAGKNYGWPAVTEGLDYSGAYVSPFTQHPDMEPSMITWTPSIAPSGLAFYSGSAFPGWQGSLFVGALVDREVRRLSIDSGKVVAEEALFAELEMRIRDVRQGPDGLLYLLTDEGRFIRVTPDA